MKFSLCDVMLLCDPHIFLCVQENIHITKPEISLRKPLFSLCSSNRPVRGWSI